MIIFPDRPTAWAISNYSQDMILIHVPGSTIHFPELNNHFPESNDHFTESNDHFPGIKWICFFMTGHKKTLSATGHKKNTWPPAGPRVPFWDLSDPKSNFFKESSGWGADLPGIKLIRKTGRCFLWPVIKKQIHMAIHGDSIWPSMGAAFGHPWGSCGMFAQLFKFHPLGTS